jgi:hypothetical protein
MSRFHSKRHNFNHHTNTTVGYPDSASDPIASHDDPFQGDFVLANGAIYAPTAVFSNSISNLSVDTLTVSNTIANLTVGTLTTTSVTGNGSGLTNVNATQLNNENGSVFERFTNKNQAGGYAGLNGDGVIDASLLSSNIELTSINDIPMGEFLVETDLSSTVAPLIPSANPSGYEVPLEFIPDNIEAKTLNGLSSDEYLQTTELSSTVAPLIPSDNPSGYEVPLEFIPAGNRNRYVGFFDYNASNNLSSVTLTVNDWNIIENDITGLYTLTSYGPTGITKVWDESSNSFDFSELNLGDMVDIRLDISVTTTSNNQEVMVDLVLAKGTPSEYRIPFVYPITFKTAGEIGIVKYNSIYMGNNDTLIGGGNFEIRSDDAATMKVNGWYCKIVRREF